MKLSVNVEENTPAHLAFAPAEAGGAGMTLVPNTLFRLREQLHLTSSDLLVLLGIISWADGGLKASCSYSQLRSSTGLSTSTCQRCVEHMVGLGILNILNSDHWEYNPGGHGLPRRKPLVYGLKGLHGKLYSLMKSQLKE